MNDALNENGAATLQGDDANEPSALMVHALAYLGRGWKVFPLRARRKIPRAGTDWDSPTWLGGISADEARATFSGNANIAVATGEVSGIWVLDVDPAAGGIETMTKLTEEHGRLPDTFTVQTRAGGWHFYFTMPGFDLRNSQNRVGPGVDVRANGGYVVAPPSYVEADEKGPAGVYVVARPMEPVAAPDWLLALAHKERAPQMGPKATAAPKDIDPAADEIGREWIIAEVERLDALERPWRPGAGWHNTCFEVACSLVRFANSSWCSLTQDEAQTLFAEHAPHDEKWNAAAEWREGMRVVGDEAREKPRGAERDPGGLFASVSSRQAQQQAVTALTGIAYTDDYEVTGAPLQAELAHHFVNDRLVGRVAYMLGFGWHAWNGRVWAPVDETVVIGMLKSWCSQRIVALRSEYGDSAPDSVKDEAKALGKLLDNASDARKTVGIWAKGDVLMQPDVFDSDPHLLNVRNGIVDLRTGALMRHDPFKMMTKIAGVDYHEGATHPDWDKALQAVRDDETREYLQIVVGQAITGHKPDDDRARFLEGGGANAKSTIVAGLMHAAGTYAMYASKKIVLALGNEHTTDMADLKGVRLALIEELPETGGANPSINVGRLKEMLGTERIRARKMRQDNVEFDVTHSLLITTNYTPAVKDTDHGTWRRMCRIVFPFRYTAAPVGDDDRLADPGLRPRIEAGREGQHEAALAWMVDGARRWYANGDGTHGRMPEMPLQVQLDTDAWRQSQDVIFEFLNSGVIEFVPGSFVLSTELHSVFRQLLAGTDAAQMDIQLFANRFAAHGVVKDHRVGIARKRTANLALSRSSVDALPAPEKAQVWVGVAFTDKARKDAFFGGVQ